MHFVYWKFPFYSHVVSVETSVVHHSGMAMQEARHDTHSMHFFMIQMRKPEFYTLLDSQPMAELLLKQFVDFSVHMPPCSTFLGGRAATTLAFSPC